MPQRGQEHMRAITPEVLLVRTVVHIQVVTTHHTLGLIRDHITQHTLACIQVDTSVITREYIPDHISKRLLVLIKQPGRVITQARIKQPTQDFMLVPITRRIPLPGQQTGLVHSPGHIPVRIHEHSQEVTREHMVIIIREVILDRTPATIQEVLSDILWVIIKECLLVIIPHIIVPPFIMVDTLIRKII